MSPKINARWLILIALCLFPALPGGCQFASQFGAPNGAPESLGTVADKLSSALFGLDLPSVPAGRVKVQFVNQSFHDADTRVTMRVAGNLVRQVERRIEALHDDLVIGPDFADSVVTEATVLADPPRSITIGDFRLGDGFQNGDTIVITIPPDPIDNTNTNTNDNGNTNTNGNENTNTNTNTNENPPEVSLSLTGLDDDQRINAGTSVPFQIALTNASESATVRAFAFLAGTTDGVEIGIFDGPAAGDVTNRSWDTSGVSPGLYAITASVTDGARAATQTAPGTVRINAQPSIVITAPRDGLIVTIGDELIIAWAGQDDDDDAKIKVFLDRDNDLGNGVDLVVAENISEDDVSNRQIDVDTTDLDFETVYAGVLIDDGLTQQTAYTGAFCLTPRLVGRFVAGEMGPGRATAILGGESSHFVGTDIDVSQDLNGDGKCDVLVADPGETFGQAGSLGAVYLNQVADEWGQSVPLAAFSTRIIGSQNGAQTGARAALLPSVDGAGHADVIIGAPFQSPHTLPAGRAVVLAGNVALRRDEIDLANDLVFTANGPLDGGAPLPGGPDNGGVPATQIDGVAYEQAGRDVAGIGDIDGDEHADYAVGAAHFGEFEEGRVALVAGGRMRGLVSTNEVGDSAAKGAIAFGDTPNGMAGFSIAASGDFSGDGVDDVLIGAPRAERPRSDGAPRTGVVYLVFGEDGILQAGESYNIPLGDVGDDEGPPGIAFVGENEGDLAGAALASGDFDHDGKPDLLIGAPGYADGGGRVYLIFNQPLPAIVDLSQVGGVVAGATFDGPDAGDALGFAVSRADADGDGADDILIGAPGALGGTGAAYLIYGAQQLAGQPSLLNLPRCELLGLQLVGDAPLSRFGSSVSGGGDVNGDGKGDFAVGAPGDPDDEAAPQGRAYVFYGK